MLSSITPLGERARNRRWSRTVAYYVAGSLAGGVAVGMLAGGLGQAVLGSHGAGGRGRALAAAALVLGALALDNRVGGLRLPSIRRQVNENWLGRYRSWVLGLGFGAQLGFGLATIVTSASVYLMVALAGLTGSLAAGALAGATFGLTRALPVLATARITSFAQLSALHGSLAAWARPAHRMTLGVEAAALLAVLALAAGVG